jgi:hypothetical protein
MEEHLIRIDVNPVPTKAEAVTEKPEKLKCECSYTNLKITIAIVALLCVGAFVLFELVHYL